MKRTLIVTMLLLWSGSCSAGGFPFVAACEEVIKSRLIAPSTYHRIKLTEDREPITLDQLVAGLDDDNVKKFFRQTATREPVRQVALIEYDAMNAHGVPLRGKSSCTYDSATDFDLDVDQAKRLVKVDGSYSFRDEFTLKRRSDGPEAATR